MRRGDGVCDAGGARRRGNEGGDLGVWVCVNRVVGSMGGRAIR